LQQEIEALNKLNEDNKSQNVEWLKQCEDHLLKVNNQEADKIKLKEENENFKNRLEEKDFKVEIIENKLKAYVESSIKAKYLHSQYEKSLFDMKSGFRAKEDNYKKRIEEANDILNIIIKEQVKEFEISNSRNTNEIKKLEAQLIENKFENQSFFEKILKIEKNLTENKQNGIAN